jgi:hypothetical protein
MGNDVEVPEYMWFKHLYEDVVCSDKEEKAGLCREECSIIGRNDLSNLFWIGSRRTSTGD